MPYLGNRIWGSDGAYVLARMRYLIGEAPEPTCEGWGADPHRKGALDVVASNLVRAIQAVPATTP